MKKLLLIGILVALLGATIVSRNFLANRFFRASQLPDIREEVKEAVVELLPPEKKEISAPPPLRVAKESPVSLLTQAGVLAWTNAERTDRGLRPFTANAALHAVSRLRLEDMFQKQYFEHVSPQGIGAAQVAEQVGYEFIAIGENIALGNFENDKALVQAWMDSPGHRANIVSAKYTELGVWVGEGFFEGRRQWIAVQIFGLPRSACPAIDESLEAKIENLKIEIENREAEAKAMREELEGAEPRTREEREAYNKRVREYNAIVEEINAKILEAKNAVSEYNAIVTAVNDCFAKIQ